MLEMLGFAVFPYVALVGTMAVGQRNMVFHPGRETPSPAEAGLPEMVAVPVHTADGLEISSWYAQPSRAGAATVVLFHGNTGTVADRADKARALLAAGYGVALAGYRGYGPNPGRPSEHGFYDDARALLGWLAAQGVPAAKLVLFGESLGTGVAVQMACEYTVAGLILEAPYTRLPALAPAYILPPLADLLMLDKFDSLSKIADVTAPLLIVHGEKDGVVPISMGRSLLAAAGGPKDGVFLAEAAHNDVWDKGGNQAVLRFLEDRS